MKPDATNGKKAPIVIRNGSVAARIYETRKADGYTSYVLSYHVDGKRKVRFFKTLTLARAEARKQVDALAAGEVVGLGFTARERLAFDRATELLAPLGLPVDTVVAQFVEAHAVLAGAGASIAEACKDYARRHAGVVPDVTVPEAVAQLLEQLAVEQASTTNGIRRKDSWVKLLKAHLGKLARDFQCMVADLDGAMIEPWLAGLKGAERTRRNVRDCVAFFVKWAKVRGLLAKDADPLADVLKPRKRKVGAVQVITPEQLAKLFEYVPDNLLAYLALRAFGGLRDSEARALQWEHVDLADGWVEIPESVAKQSDKDSVRRMVKVREPLDAWLRPIAKRVGPVCTVKNTANALGELSEAAKVDLPRNCLRHGFISAAVTLSNDLNATAIESGNSPAVIRAHYWRKMRPEQAAAWFAVVPSVGAAVVPMRAVQ